MALLRNISGNKYGYLTAISFAGRIKSKYMWAFRCDCGNEVVLGSDAVKRGGTSSCGCKHGELISKAKTKHGFTEHPLFSIYLGIIARCEHPQRKEYKNYGGRGIKICPEWRNDFLRFVKDVGERPSDAHELDRENNNGNYEPSNVRWVTHKENQQNRRGVILNSDVVFIARKMFNRGFNAKNISDFFGINITTIKNAVQYKTWS